MNKIEHFYNNNVIHVDLKSKTSKKIKNKNMRNVVLNVILELSKIAYKNKSIEEKEKEEEKALSLC